MVKSGDVRNRPWCWAGRSFNCLTLLIILSLELFSGCGTSYVGAHAPGLFAATESMQSERFAFASTRMIAGPLSGEILVTGGITSNNSAIATAELYDPGNGKFTGTNDMTSPRAYHTATALGDGTVLVVGGIDSAGNPLDSAELFNPAMETFSPVSLPNMTLWQHSAVPFCAEHTSDGYLYSTFTEGEGGSACPAGYDVDVLIAGGFTDKAGDVPSSQAAIYDARTQTFTPLSPMPTAVAGAAAVLVPTTTADAAGNAEPDILIIGGTGPGGMSMKTFQLYPLGGLASSPYGGAWLQAPSLGTTTAVSYPTATVLENEPSKPTDLSPCDGVVVIAGGQPMPSGQTTDLFYLYQPGPEGHFGAIIASGAMQEARVHDTATLLGLINNGIPDAGRVLITGGEQNVGGGFSTLSTAETYMPAVLGGKCSLGSFLLTPDAMVTPRWYQSATAFRDGTGRVLIAGGKDAATVQATAEIFTP